MNERMQSTIAPSVVFSAPEGGDLTPAQQGELLQAVANHGDQGAFTTLFTYFAPRIKSFLMKGGMTPDQADELAQEVMLTLWNKAAQYDPAQARVNTWIFTIARNKKIDHFRKIRRIEPDPSDPLWEQEERPNAERDLDRIQTEKEMVKAFETLSGDQKDLLQKAFFEDKSHTQIAAETGIPLGTVKSRIRQALTKLRKALGEEKK